MDSNRLLRIGRGRRRPHRDVHRQTRGALPIIGVGGIFNAADAWEKIAAGASLIQIYTGLVYEGPSICKEIVKGLKHQVEAKGLSQLSQAVGHCTDNPSK